MDSVQREMRIRKRIESIYTKKLEDFASKEEYDDYLETIEDIVLSLANNIDVNKYEGMVQEYQRAQAQAAAASTTGRPAAAGASAASAVLYAPAAYAPSAGPSLTQPKPRHDYAMDAEGNLIPARHWRSLAKSQLDVAAAACGWSSDIPRKRAWQEAFAALFGAVRIDQQELMGGSSA